MTDYELFGPWTGNAIHQYPIRRKSKLRSTFIALAMYPAHVGAFVVNLLNGGMK